MSSNYYGRTCNMTSSLIGVEEAAEILGLTRNGVNVRVQRGDLNPAAVIGKRGTRIFYRGEIEAIARVEGKTK